MQNGAQSLSASAADCACFWSAYRPNTADPVPVMAGIRRRLGFRVRRKAFQWTDIAIARHFVARFWTGLQKLSNRRT